MNHGRFLAIVASYFVSAFSALAGAGSTPQDYAYKAQQAGVALEQIRAMPDSKAIPDKLLAQATCIASVPHVLRFGFIFAYARGYGLVSCRTSATSWSEPAYIRLSAPSLGFQAGGDGTDLVLIYLDATAVNELSRPAYLVEGDASASVGVVGRSSQVGTDVRLNSRVIAYSKSEGLFGGISVTGVEISPDETANSVVYGGYPDPKVLLSTEARGDIGMMTFIRQLP